MGHQIDFKVGYSRENSCLRTALCLGAKRLRLKAPSIQGLLTLVNILAAWFLSYDTDCITAQIEDFDF